MGIWDSPRSWIRSAARKLPVLSQLFMIFGTLIYLALNGHLVLLSSLADSYKQPADRGMHTSTVTSC